MWTPETVALVTATFLIGGIVKGITGLGLPIVALAMMATALGVKATIGIMLGPCIVTNIWMALAGPALNELLRRLWSYLLAAVVGVWFGVNLLAGMRGEILLVLLGVILAVYSLLSLMRPQVPPPGERENLYSPIAGGLGGILFGMTGTFMVPGILYLQALGFDRNMLVQALGLSFVCISVTLAVSFTRHDLIPADMALLGAYAVLPTAVGIVVGSRFRHRISEERFRRIFFVCLFFVGIYTVARGVL